MTLKLVEAGIPKERLGLMAIPLIPVQLALPLVIAKYTTGPRPLDIFLKAIPYRLLFGFVAAFLVWVTPILVPDASQGFVDPLTWKQCSGGTESLDNSCRNSVEKEVSPTGGVAVY
jgi:hypothetical protein